MSICSATSCRHLSVQSTYILQENTNLHTQKKTVTILLKFAKMEISICLELKQRSLELLKTVNGERKHIITHQKEAIRELLSVKNQENSNIKIDNGMTTFFYKGRSTDISVVGTASC